MLSVSHLLEWAAKITPRPGCKPRGQRSSRRQRCPRAILFVQELEPRVVPTLLGQNLFPADYPWNQ